MICPGVRSFSDNTEIEKEELPNGHFAYLATKEGMHTPGLNSDQIYLSRKEENKSGEGANRLLTLVNDGVTGEKPGLGHFAANLFCREIPKYWKADLEKYAFVFDRSARTPKRQLIKNNREAFSWLLGHIYHPIFSKDTIEIVFTRYMDLLLNLDNLKIQFDFRDKTLEEVAEIVLIDCGRFQETARILLAIYEAAKTGQRSFYKRYKDQLMADVEKENYCGATTCGGVVETPDDYILFGIGDSPVFAVDRFGLLPGMRTRNFSDKEGRLSSALGWIIDKDCHKASESEIILPPGGYVREDVLEWPSEISMLYLKKNVISPETVIVGMTDGFGNSDKSLMDIAEKICGEIGDIRMAIFDVLEMAEEKERFRFDKYEKYSPDDRSMVIIGKNRRREY